jgi:hypothetical protein
VIPCLKHSRTHARMHDRMHDRTHSPVLRGWGLRQARRRRRGTSRSASTPRGYHGHSALRRKAPAPARQRCAGPLPRSCWIHENIVITAFANTHIGDRSSKHAHGMKNGMRHQTGQEVAGNMHKQSRRTSYKYFCRDLLRPPPPSPPLTPRPTPRLTPPAEL